MTQTQQGSDPHTGTTDGPDHASSDVSADPEHGIARSPAPDAGVRRVVATAAALALIDKLKAEHGPLMFHQSGGCCDGSAPMCFSLGEFMVGGSDVKLGDIGGAPFYMSESQFEYWEHTQLIIDAVPGSGGMFSLERPSGLRFLTRSRLYDDEESAWLEAHPVEHAD